MDDTGILTNDGRLGIHEEGRRSTLKCLLIYTGCFIVLCFFVYFLFVTNGRTLIRYFSAHLDSFAQKYAFVFEMKHFLNTLFQAGEINTWDWTIGLGADAHAFNVSYLLSPSQYFLYLTPAKYVDAAYSIVIIARIYMSGVAFILFAREIGLDDCQVIMGAIAYSFCPWIIVSSLFQSGFLQGSMMFPLVMLGEEKLIKHKSPLTFILAVAYTTFSIFSFAYMIAFIVLIYYVVRLLTDGVQRSTNEIVRMTVLLMLSGIAGILLAGESFVLTVLKFGETSSSTGFVTGMLWSAREYLAMPLGFVSWDRSFEDSAIIAIAAIGTVMLPMIVYKAIRRETDSIMTVMMFIFVLFPIVNRFFNFFSYPTGRWMFMLVFFYALAAAECFDKDLLLEKKNRIIITAAFAVYLPYVAIMQRTVEDGFIRLTILFSCITCALIIAVIWMYFRPAVYSEKGYKTAAVLIIVIMSVGIALNHNNKMIPRYETYLKIGEGQEKMNESPQRVAPMIKDDDFYRVDQAKVKKINEQMYFGNRSEYVFYSYIDVGWLEYNRLLGNNQSYFKRIRTKSNDNRFGLDFLQGVKYFMGSYGKKQDLSGYAGFGYEPFDTIDGVEVLKNKYNIGIGCMFDSYIRRAEWDKLNFADREYAMLMGVVVPDDQEMPAGMRELKAADIQSGVELVPYEIRSNKKKTKYYINCKNDDDHQLLMTLENVQADGESQIELKVKNGNIKKSLVNTRGDIRGYAEETMRDLTVNLGCGEEAGSEIKVKLEPDEEDNTPTYVTIGDVKLYSMPLETYQKCAEKLVDNKLNITRFTNDHITGTVKTDKPQVLYLSVFDNNGWDVYIDGKKADVREEVDIAFIGVDIEPGEHEVDIIYHSKGALEGLLVTLAGVILTVIIMLMWKKQSAAEPSE